MTTSTNDPQARLSSVLSLIEAREAELRSRLAGVERSVLLDLIRAIDSVGYFRAYAPTARVSDLPSYLEVSWLGVARALASFAPAGMQGFGAAWHRSSQDKALWASTYLYRAGMVAHVYRLGELVRYGLAELQMPAPDHLRFVIRAEDSESIDREAISWYARHLGQQVRPLLDTLEADQGAWVTKELSRRVDSDPVYGIRYSSSRELEEYFETYAELRAQSLPGHDSLPPSSQIGPLTFGQFRTGVVTGMARCLKHAAFVDSLLVRETHVDPRDILTIFSFEGDLKSQWGGLLRLDDQDSGVLLNATGITTGDVPLLRSTFDCPQALLIRAGDEHWYKPVYGGLNNPFPWLSRKLRRTFRRDWDRAVNEREGAFRDDLRALFYEPRFYVSARSQKLKGPKGVLTDIDAIAIDRASGTMAVFQLKWQDSFENSLAERASRQRNLCTEGNAWTETVLAFCDGLNGSEAAQRFGVPEAEAARVSSMRLFVLTRNGARFSGALTQDSRAAWISWFDLLRRCNLAKRDKDPLSRVWRSARRKTKPRIDGRPSVFELEGVRIEVVAT